MAKSMKEHVKGLAECMGDHHKAMAECHGEAANSSDGFQKTFHSTAAEAHSAAAEKCMKVLEECSKADESSDLEKITASERALLAKLARTVIPDHVRSVGTDNPNRLIARQGDPQPQTSDSEIPQEFVDVFAV
jgi:hypothetical protein